MDHIYIYHIQNYFKHIIKKHEIVTDDHPTRIYINKIENSITFKIKTEYYLKLSTPETMKLFGSINNKITKDKNYEKVPFNEVVLVHCNIVNNDYQNHSIILYTIVPSKSFGQLLNILTKYFIFLKTFNSEFSYTEVWFTDQNCKPREIEHKINIALVIN